MVRIFGIILAVVFAVVLPLWLVYGTYAVVDAYRNFSKENRPRIAWIRITVLSIIALMISALGCAALMQECGWW